MYSETITKFKQYYRGEEDNIIDECENDNVVTDSSPQTTTIHSVPLEFRSGNYAEAVIRMDNDDNPGILRHMYLSDEKNVRWVAFEVGGQRFDRVPADVFPVLRTLYNMMNQHELPFHCIRKGFPLLPYMNIVIQVYFNTGKRRQRKPIMVYFEVERCPPTSLSKSFVFGQCQDIGPIQVQSERTQLDYLTHPIEYLLVKKTPRKQDSNSPLTLSLEEGKYELVLLEGTTIGEWQVYRLDGINFSNVCKPVLIHSKGSVQRIIGTSLHVCLISNGMAGLRYTTTRPVLL